MKIALINLPGREEAPLDLCYIGSYLKVRGHGDLKLIDLSIAEQEIPQTTFYCISCSPSQYVQISEVVSKIDPVLSYVAVIGKFAIDHTYECLNLPSIDMAVMGDPEIPITMLVEGYKPSDIPGMATMYHGELIGTTGHHGGRRLVLNSKLDELPFPNRELLDAKWRKSPMTLISSRMGLGNEVRYRSVEDVLREVSFLNSKYKVEDFILSEPRNEERESQFNKEFKSRNLSWRY